MRLCVSWTAAILAHQPAGVVHAVKISAFITMRADLAAATVSEVDCTCFIVLSGQLLYCRQRMPTCGHPGLHVKVITGHDTGAATPQVVVRRAHSQESTQLRALCSNVWQPGQAVRQVPLLNSGSTSNNLESSPHYAVDIAVCNVPSPAGESVP